MKGAGMEDKKTKVRMRRKWLWHCAVVGIDNFHFHFANERQKGFVYALFFPFLQLFSHFASPSFQQERLRNNEFPLDTSQPFFFFIRYASRIFCSLYSSFIICKQLTRGRIATIPFKTSSFAHRSYSNARLFCWGIKHSTFNSIKILRLQVILGISCWQSNVISWTSFSTAYVQAYLLLENYDTHNYSSRNTGLKFVENGNAKQKIFNETIFE